ncbi:MAG: DHA2 family efflux MFS transporter permease subunit, partial [Myxococcales bacterium]|nr:DHA2 family efflux MFS transporter permease subunit [Myxococcales bacterium]
SILFETFPREEQAMAQGLFTAVVIAGPAIGPTLGGYIVTNLDWRWIFFINVPIGVVATMACLAFLPKDEKDGAKGSIDGWAIALLAIGLGAAQTFLEEGQTEDWFDSPFIVFLAVTSVVALVTFVWRTLTAKEPVVDLRVLRYRSLWSGALICAVVGMGLYGALFAVPIFAQSIMGLTSQQTGMLLLPGALTSAFAMPIVATLNRKVDPRVLVGAGALIIVATMFQLNHLTPQTGEADLFWPLVTRAFGTTLMFLPLSLAALGAVPKKEVAAATGLYNLTRQLGGSIGIAILTTLLARREQFHRSVLVEKLVSDAPAVQARVDALAGGLLAKGMTAPEAHTKALALLDGNVSAQAAVMSFADTFTATAALFVMVLPLLFLLGKPSGDAKGAGAGVH